MESAIKFIFCFLILNTLSGNKTDFSKFLSELSLCCFLVFPSLCFEVRDPGSASYSGGGGKKVWGNFCLPLCCKYNSGNLQTFGGGGYKAGWEVTKCSNFIKIV